MESIKKSRWQHGIFYVLLFLGLFVFFTQVHMLVPYDGDDWNLIMHMRHAFPLAGGWNPAKVLPENLYPIAGYIAAYAVNPVIHDYVASITGVSAFLYSALIVIYIYMFGTVINRYFKLPWYQTAGIMLVFFMLHFWSFKSHSEAAPYFFKALDLTCVYHYSIPALLNASVVFYFMSHKIGGRFPSGLGLLKGSLLILAIYLSIFSNIQQSIILASFLGMLFLQDAGRKILQVGEWKNLLKRNRFIVVILLIWLFSLLFEATGGNAHHIGNSLSHLPVGQAIHAFGLFLKNINYLFLAFAVVSLGAAGYVYRKLKPREIFDTKNDFGKMMGICGGAGLLSLVYLTLVCSKAEPGYLGRPDVLIGVFIWLFTTVCFSLAYLLDHYPRIFLAAPVALFVIACEILKGPGTFAESVLGNVNPKTAYAIDYEIIYQLQEADQTDAKGIVLVVPQGRDKDNWPHPTWYRINKTLYYHGITSRKIEVTIQPDADMNTKYHIPIPEDL